MRHLNLIFCCLLMLCLHAVAGQAQRRHQPQSTKGAEGATLPDAVVLRGTIVPPGTTLPYAGNGTYSGTVTLDRPVTGTYVDKTVAFVTPAGQPLPIDPLHLNQGTYRLTADVVGRTCRVEAPVDTCRISVFGSSVSNGQGARLMHGYAWQYDSLLQRRHATGQSRVPFRLSSIAINGNSTRHLLARYHDLGHDFGRYVILGLSMGNEGIHEATPEAKDSVMEQWDRGMRQLIAQARRDGKVPVVMNNYTRADFTPLDYHYIKLMNLRLHEWDVPSVNLLGAIDDMHGHWATGYVADLWHPSTEGHAEMMAAIDPTLFDALAAGKPLPTRDRSHTLGLGPDQQLTARVEGVRAFTLSLSYDRLAPGSTITVAGDTTLCRLTRQGDRSLTISIAGDAAGPHTVSLPHAADDGTHVLTLTHYHAQRCLLVYCDETLLYTAQARMEPTRLALGGAATLSEVAFWRAALSPEEIAAWGRGGMLRSSLEIYAPATATPQATLPNRAQSMNAGLHIATLPIHPHP